MKKKHFRIILILTLSYLISFSTILGVLPQKVKAGSNSNARFYFCPNCLSPDKSKLLINVTNDLEEEEKEEIRIVNLKNKKVLYSKVIEDVQLYLTQWKNNEEVYCSTELSLETIKRFFVSSQISVINVAEGSYDILFGLARQRYKPPFMNDDRIVFAELVKPSWAAFNKDQPDWPWKRPRTTQAIKIVNIETLKETFIDEIGRPPFRGDIIFKPCWIPRTEKILYVKDGDLWITDSIAKKKRILIRRKRLEELLSKFIKEKGKDYSFKIRIADVFFSDNPSIFYLYTWVIPKENGFSIIDSTRSLWGVNLKSKKAKLKIIEVLPVLSPMTIVVSPDGEKIAFEHSVLLSNKKKLEIARIRDIKRDKEYELKEPTVFVWLSNDELLYLRKGKELWVYSIKSNKHEIIYKID